MYVLAFSCACNSLNAGAKTAVTGNPDTPRTLTTVRVEGEAEPANETSLGKSALSLRDTPQSVSIVSRERLDDQNISSLPEIMKYTTGVTVQRFDGAGLFNTFHARGTARSLSAARITLTVRSRF